MTRILAALVGALMAGNGIIMVVDPPAWYASVPGVADTGPLNLHFVRDIGFAYFTAGAALVWGAFGGGWKVSASAQLCRHAERTAEGDVLAISNRAS